MGHCALASRASPDGAHGAHSHIRQKNVLLHYHCIRVVRSDGDRFLSFESTSLPPHLPQFNGEALLITKSEFRLLCCAARQQPKEEHQGGFPKTCSLLHSASRGFLFSPTQAVIWGLGGRLLSQIRTAYERASGFRIFKINPKHFVWVSHVSQPGEFKNVESKSNMRSPSPS
jgi:hypothetical protein